MNVRILAAEAPRRQGARSEHARMYVSDEQRRRREWIGGQKRKGIFERVLGPMKRALALAGLLSAVVACRSNEGDHRGAAVRDPGAASDAAASAEAGAPALRDDATDQNRAHEGAGPPEVRPRAEARGSVADTRRAPGTEPGLAEGRAESDGPSGPRVDATPAAPTDPLEPPPLPPALAAHLALVEQAQGLQIVAQIDARGIGGAAIFRLGAARACPPAAGPSFPPEPAGVLPEWKWAYPLSRQRGWCLHGQPPSYPFFVE